MQTNLADFISDTPDGAGGRRASCAAACTAVSAPPPVPTYQLLGDELDGPRGRIYLIKQVLEGEPVTAQAPNCTWTAA